MKKITKIIVCIAIIAIMATVGAVAFTACNKTSDKTLTVATNAAFPPFEFKDGDAFKGIDMDIMAAFASDNGYTLKIEDMEFDSVVASVGTTTKIGAAALTVNETRKKTVNFSTSYYNASQKLIVKATDTTFDGLTTVAQVEAKLGEYGANTKIGVQNGTTGLYYVEGDEDWGFDGFTNLKATGYTTVALAVQDLIAGNVAAVVVDEGPASVLASSNSNIKVINVALTEEEYAFAVDKADTELLNTLNAWIAANQTKINAIISEYFGA